MEYQGNESIVLTNEEFLTLLAASGIEKWYGTDLEEEKKSLESDKAYNRCLASLYKKELIDWKSEKAVISDDYKAIFTLLKDADMAVAADFAGREGFITTCYFGKDRVVNIEGRPSLTGEVEISIRDKAEWVSDLMASAYLPESSIEADPDEIEDLSVAPGDYCCKFELVKLPSGEPIESMIISDAGVYSIMETSKGRENFSSDRMVEILTLWSGGNE